MTTTEHLQKIKAECERLLTISEKRTQGKWEIGDRRYKTPVQCGKKHVAMVNFYKCGQPDQDVYGDEHESNAQFIAECGSGAAEDGWRSTIAAIDLIFELHAIDISELTVTKKILAAWPTELLT